VRSAPVPAATTTTLYRLEVAVTGRADKLANGDPSNAVAAAAYRGALKLVAPGGKVHDYTPRQQRVVDNFIIHPGPAPEWAYDPQSLWEAVENAENRKDAQLFREFTLTLPYGLEWETQRAMVTEFVQTELVPLGMSAAVSLHMPKITDVDAANPHAHVNCPLRAMTAEGLARTKDRSWNKYDLLAQWRKSWETIENRYLKAAGLPLVDSRTLRAQGIDRPTLNLSKAGYHISHEGRDGVESLEVQHKLAQIAERQELETQLEQTEQKLLEVTREITRLEKPGAAQPHAARPTPRQRRAAALEAASRIWRRTGHWPHAGGAATEQQQRQPGGFQPRIEVHRPTVKPGIEPGQRRILVPEIGRGVGAPAVGPIAASATPHPRGPGGTVPGGTPSDARELRDPSPAVDPGLRTAASVSGGLLPGADQRPAGIDHGGEGPHPERRDEGRPGPGQQSDGRPGLTVLGGVLGGSEHLGAPGGGTQQTAGSLVRTDLGAVPGGRNAEPSQPVAHRGTDPQDPGAPVHGHPGSLPAQPGPVGSGRPGGLQNPAVLHHDASRGAGGLILPATWDKRISQPAALDLCDLVPHLVGHQAVTTIQKFGPPREAAISLVAERRGLTTEDGIRAHEPHLRAEAVARVMLWARAVWDKATGLFLPAEYREARERLHDRDLTDFRAGTGGEPVVVMAGREMPMAEAVRRAMKPAMPSRIVVPELPTPAPAPPQPQSAPKKAAVLPLPALIPQSEEEEEEPKVKLKKPLRVGGKPVAWTSGELDDGYLRRQGAREVPTVDPNDGGGSSSALGGDPAPGGRKPDVGGGTAPAKHGNKKPK